MMDQKSKLYMGGLLAGLLYLPGALWADCSIVTNSDTNAISAYSLSGQGNFSCNDLGMYDGTVSKVTVVGNTLDWEIGGEQVDAVAVEDSSGKRCVYNYDASATGGAGLEPPSEKDISHHLICTDRVGSNTAPVVTITLPDIGPDDPPFPGGYEIHFQGQAYDNEDEDLTAAQLRWSSSLDGSLGVGADVYVSDLSAGQHLITAQVTDNGLDGSVPLTGSDSLLIDVLVTETQNCEIVVGENTTSVLINDVAVACPEGDEPRLVCSADLSDDADKFELGSTACCLCNATAVECDPSLAEGDETGELIACPDSDGTKGALQVPSTLMFNNDPYYCYTIGGKRTCFAY